MKKKKDIMLDALKEARRQSREAEIEAYGHPINYNKVFVSKKVYSRKRRIDF